MTRLQFLVPPPFVGMGQSSSQPATKPTPKPEVPSKPKKKKKGKKLKGKKRADTDGDAQEEEIAQEVPEMEGVIAPDLNGHGNEDDLAASNQLLAESSPRRDVLGKSNGESVLLQEKVRSKRKAKTSDRVRKGRNKDVDIDLHDYDHREGLANGVSRGLKNHTNGVRRSEQALGSSQAVPSLDDIDTNDEEVASYLQEYNGQLPLAEPSTQASPARNGPEDDASVQVVASSYDENGTTADSMHVGYQPPLRQYLSSTDYSGKKRKRKSERGNAGSTGLTARNVDEDSSARNGNTPKASAHQRHAKERTLRRNVEATSDLHDEEATEEANQRTTSPDLYDLPRDSVLPGIEDPTSPHRRTDKRATRQHEPVNGNGHPRTHPLFLNNRDRAHNEVQQVAKMTSSKRKRRLPVADNQVTGSDQPRKKAKSVDYKTQQVRKPSSSQGENLEEGVRKEGPYTETEVAKLFAFRDRYCEENELTQQDFIKKVRESAHNNIKNIEFWSDVCDVVPHRPRHSVQRLCRRRFHNYTKRGTWTKEEDDELRAAYEQHGNRWKAIGEQIERMPEDCRDRWRNHLKDNEFRNRDLWTEYEIECLEEAVAECIAAMREAKQEHRDREAYGRDPAEQPDEDEREMINWGVVSAKLGGSRSRLQCSYKWKWLQEEPQRKLKEQEKKLKKLVEKGLKKSRTWRVKQAEKKYQCMLPGDKYELLDA